MAYSPMFPRQNRDTVTDIAGEAKKLVELASRPPKGFLIRSLDAIHAASAVISKASFVVATDERLRRATELMGLKLCP